MREIAWLCALLLLAGCTTEDESFDVECDEVCGRVWGCEDELVSEMSQEDFDGIFGENLEHCNEDIQEVCGVGSLPEDCLGCFDGSVSCDGLFACIMTYCAEVL